MTTYRIVKNAFGSHKIQFRLLFWWIDVIEKGCVSPWYYPSLETAQVRVVELKREEEHGEWKQVWP